MLHNKKYVQSKFIKHIPFDLFTTEYLDASEFLSHYIWWQSVSASGMPCIYILFCNGSKHNSSFPHIVRQLKDPLWQETCLTFSFSAHMSSLLYMQQTGKVGHSAKAKGEENICVHRYIFVCSLHVAVNYCKWNFFSSCLSNIR